MNRVSKVLVVVLLMLLMVVPLVGAQEQSIVDIAVSDGRFDTLVAAVVAADLDGALSGGEWTVFAPTDEAFAKLGLDASNIASAMSKEELTDILLYHVLPVNVSSAEAKGLLGDVTMANGKIAGLKYFDDSLWVNDDSRVIIQDIAASNGTIHVVDNVILPPWPRVDSETEMEMPSESDEMMDQETTAAPAETAAAPEAEAMAEEAPAPAISGNSITAIASRDDRFSTLVAAVVAADLAGALSSGEWTVFAPTNDAFAKLGLNAGNIGDAFSKEELTDILLYHAIPASVSSAEAKTLLGDVTMANGKLAGLKYFDDSLWVNDDSRVIIENIIADNGTIHAVDNVILGPWPRD
jgi:transforming growth factor-beta-induced protein